VLLLPSAATRCSFAQSTAAAGCLLKTAAAAIAAPLLLLLLQCCQLTRHTCELHVCEMCDQQMPRSCGVLGPCWCHVLLLLLLLV
jgi:hypothetical protein